MMSDDDMFEASFGRPRDYFQLSGAQQWAIDQRLGILDWPREHHYFMRLTPLQQARLRAHYDTPAGGWQ